MLYFLCWSSSRSLVRTHAPRGRGSHSYGFQDLGSSQISSSPRHCHVLDTFLRSYITSTWVMGISCWNPHFTHLINTERILGRYVVKRFHFRDSGVGGGDFDGLIQAVGDGHLAGVESIVDTFGQLE